MLRFGSMVSVSAACLVAATVAFATPETPRHVGDPYPLTTDAVTGEPLGEKPIRIDHEGREVRVATEANAAAFREDPATHLAKVDARIVESQRPYYALETCVVSGESLDAMGEPADVVIGNRLVRLCCEGCRGDVEADPAAVFAKLDAAAIEKQKADYPLASCPVSRMELGAMGEPYDVVVAGRLVRLCCAACEDTMRAKAPSILSSIDAARGIGGEGKARAGQDHQDGSGHGDGEGDGGTRPHSHSHSHGHGH